MGLKPGGFSGGGFRCRPRLFRLGQLTCLARLFRLVRIAKLSDGIYSLTEAAFHATNFRIVSENERKRKYV